MYFLFPLRRKNAIILKKHLGIHFMQKKIRKAVFPVAGLGTRSLPATKATPKEMLPIVDKPIIQYAVEEAVAAGITELIFVTSVSKRSIEDHFDSNYELEAKLIQSGKLDSLEMIRNIPPRGAHCVYIRQHNPLGLGHAVLCARDIIGDEDFAVILADDLIANGNKLCLEQMVDVHAKINSSILALQEVPPIETEKYGIAGLADKNLKIGQASEITTIVEKPKHAPSNFAVIGRYILSPKIFDFLANTKAGAIGEIQLTDGIANLLKHEKVYGYFFEGTRYDCGNKFGCLQAIIAYAQKHPEIGKQFKDYLRNLEICR